MPSLSPQQLLAHLDRGTPWPHAFGMPVQEAYEHALVVRELRLARGEQPRGFKIGFTNRTIWKRYGVFAPIWGTVWDTTLSFCDGKGTLGLDATSEPRLEPEAVFGIAAWPAACDAALPECVARLPGRARPPCWRRRHHRHVDGCVAGQAR